MGKKKFIDKKKAATFALVFKESEEGGALGSERVFAQISGPGCFPGFEETPEHQQEEEEEEDEARDHIFDDAEEEEAGDANDGNKHEHGHQSSGMKPRRRLPQSLRQELLELGFADDGYNYMQHLRTVGSSSGSLFVPTGHRHSESLPPDVKAYDASEVKIEPVLEATEHSSNILPIKVSSSTHEIQYSRLRNEVFDQEILAALEDCDGSDCSSTDVLDDDFVIMANQVTGDRVPPSSNTSSYATHEIATTVHSHKENLLAVAEEMTNRSQSRPSRLLDEQFEMLALREYEEDNFGEAEEPDPLSKGHADISQFSSVFSEFLTSTAVSTDKYDTPVRTGEVGLTNDTEGGCQNVKGHHDTDTNMDTKLKEWYHVRYQSVPEDSRSEEEELVVESQSEDEKEQWDCQSVISTYSKLENHPAKITLPSCRPPGKHPTFGMALKSVESTSQFIQLRGRQKLPLEFVYAQGSLPKTDTKSKGEEFTPEMKHENDRNITVRKVGPRGGETPEERKARKVALREERREARKLKKDLKLQYKGVSQKAQLGVAVMGPPSIHLA